MNQPEDRQRPPRRRPAPEGSAEGKMMPAWYGVVGTIFGHIVLATLTQGIGLMLVGIAQVIYVLPALIVFAIMRQFRVVYGIGATAGITFLLNLAFCGYVAFMGSWYNG